MNGIDQLNPSFLKYMLNVEVDNKVVFNGLPPVHFRGVRCTRTAPKMSDKEYEKAIIKQAKKDAKDGIFASDGYSSLMKSYISVVSPDRKGILQRASKLLRGKGRIGNAEFKDSSNNIIARYSTNNGWSMISTPAENARSQEFCSIYNKAWNEANDIINGKVSNNKINILV